MYGLVYGMYHLVRIANHEQSVRLTMDEQQTYQRFILTHSVKMRILNNQWALVYFVNQSNHIATGLQFGYQKRWYTMEEIEPHVDFTFLSPEQLRRLSLVATVDMDFEMHSLTGLIQYYGQCGDEAVSSILDTCPTLLES